MKRRSIIVASVLVALTLVCAYLYRNRWQPLPVETEAIQAGEPENYSATIIRTIDDGTRREEFVSRVVRSGELRREESSEPGAGVSIWRPDLGKYFLLDFDRREYTEEALTPPVKIESSTESQPATGEQRLITSLSAEELIWILLKTPSPESVDTRLLPDQTLENHPCNVVERLETFADGHVEITRMYRARDLNGLAVRVEIESTESKEKVVTVWRDIRTEVSPDEFEIPKGFKKVKSLLR